MEPCGDDEQELFGQLWGDEKVQMRPRPLGAQNISLPKEQQVQSVLLLEHNWQFCEQC